MSGLCQELNFSDDERVLLNTSDEMVEAWLNAAKAGEEWAHERLLCWAYTTARKYYCLQTHSKQDAEDLAGDFVLEFEPALPKMRSATHWTRKKLRRKLWRFIFEKKLRISRETSRDEEELEKYASNNSADEAERPQESWGDKKAWYRYSRWSDEEWNEYRCVLYLLDHSDESTRSIIMYRQEDPPQSYEQIAGKVNMTPAAARMRAARFYARVRQCYRSYHRKRKPSG